VKVHNCADVLRLWFGAENNYDVSHLAVFALDNTGSLFAYWLADGEDTATAPIVILHEEGIPQSHVVANSLEEFFILFCPTIKELTSERLKGKHKEVLTSYRTWLKQSCGIEPPRTQKQVSNIEKRAEQSDPGFQSWLFSA
jgi:hypothetical protein